VVKTGTPVEIDIKNLTLSGPDPVIVRVVGQTLSDVGKRTSTGTARTRVRLTSVP
jgi:hypothetical protein